MVANTYPLVSAVVLTWNQLSLVLDCLDSLRRIDYPRFRVVAVDNGSQDGTAAMIRERCPDVTVVENRQNLGFAEGNNVGIRRSLADGADYVMLLNDDTVVAPEMVRELITFAELRPAVGIVGPVIRYQDVPHIIWSAGNTIDWRTGSLRRLCANRRDSEAPTRPYGVDYVTGCALCIKREVIERIGLLDARYFIYYEESDWCMRARAKGYEVMVIPSARIWHKVSATMKQDSPATTYYMTRNAFLFLARHMRGRARVAALARVSLRELRTTAAHSVKPQYRHLRANRDARVLGVRDALLGRWGKMGPDVEVLCFPGKQ